MKFDDLILYRDELQHAARLANLAYAYQWLSDFAERVSLAGLEGEVALKGPHPATEQTEVELVAIDCNQSVIEEHFLPEEIEELHSVFASVHEVGAIIEAKFRLEHIGSLYLPALRRALEVANVSPRRRASSSRVEGAGLDARADLF